MKIYTKKGDKGMTGLLGGTRVSKHHLRIEAYGTLDELNSWVGLLSADLTVPDPGRLLLLIQSHIFTIGSHVARDPKKKAMTLPDMNNQLTHLIEVAIDQMEVELPPLTNFILPGGSVSSAHCHIARCVCRRAERCCTALSENEALDDEILAFLNRLSDYFFVLARFTSNQNGTLEVTWTP